MKRYLAAILIATISLFLLACTNQPPTDTSSPTATITAPTPSPTLQPTQIPAESPTSTPVPTDTPQPTLEPSLTPVPSPTPTIAPTWTPVPTWTPTPEPTATPTVAPTLTPTPTQIPTPTLEPTATPLPTATATPEPTATLRPTATATPRPTETPTPVPLLSVDNGDWAYFGPDCPDAHSNCASFPSDNSFMSLRAYYDTNESFYDDARIRVSCFRGSSDFTFDGGGEWIGLGETGLNLRYEGQDVEQGTWYWTERGSDDLESVWFDNRSTQAILSFIEQADRQGRDVTMGVSGDYGTVIADFDVTGFATNFQRLPCS